MKLNTYNNIDELPIKIWFSIFESGDYRLLLKDKVDVNIKSFEKLNDKWESIVDEWIEAFGFSDEYLDNFDQAIRLANLQADYVITGQRHYLTLIKIEKEKIKLNATDIKEPKGLDSILWKMSKYYGFKLSSKELTVTEYYSAINEITDGR